MATHEVTRQVWALVMTPGAAVDPAAYAVLCRRVAEAMEVTMQRI